MSKQTELAQVADTITVDSGNVGIGTSSPNVQLKLEHANSPSVALKDLSTNDELYITVENDIAEFNAYTAGTGARVPIVFTQYTDERMRLDASGRLLHGKTTSGDYVTGTEIQPAGAILSYRSGGVAAIHGRTDDGEIIRLTSNNSIVGKIGAGSGTVYFANNTTGGIRLGTLSGSTLVLPCNETGATEDAVHDLGHSSARWRDLHLSGDVTMGNGLTGTKTIALNGGGSSSSVMNLDFLGGGTGNPSGRISYSSSTEAMTFHTGDLASISEVMRIDAAGVLKINGGSDWNETNQGTGKGSIHLDPNSDVDNTGGAITFGASDYGSGETPQAGIYTRSDGAYGSKMYLATTDSYANGPKTAIKIDHFGQVTTPRQCSFAVSKNNSHVSVGTGVVYNVVLNNTGGNYNTSNGRFTAPVQGSYFIATNHMSDNDTTYDNKYYSIRVNGNDYHRVYSSSGGAVHHRFSWAGVIALNTGDYIDVFADNVSLYGLNTTYANFSGHLLG